jgi:hypothetical protein
MTIVGAIIAHHHKNVGAIIQTTKRRSNPLEKTIKTA